MYAIKVIYTKKGLHRKILRWAERIGDNFLSKRLLFRWTYDTPLWDRSFNVGATGKGRTYRGGSLMVV